MRCFLYHNFGIKCAFCGMSRAFAAMGKGDLAASWSYHRLGPAVFAFFILQVPYRMWAVLVWPRRVPKYIRAIIFASGAVIVAGMFLNWIFYIGGRLL
ncbi:MAG: DUF2752 domain-containing protein [Anaerohalosphaeraceae bacterium]|nr:DUF2752 domain-containing protein [Anaerohalosphaeraceae bacterium]